MLNKALIIGRLTRDPEVRVIGNGTHVASFTVAVERTFKNKDGEKESDFIPVVAWRKTAELCAQYTKKGSMVAICGRIQTRTYDAADGSKRYVTEIVTDEIQFLGSKGENSSPRASISPNDNYGVSIDGLDDLEDLDVPF